MSRALFVAGATGATGRVLVQLAAPLEVDLVPHVRPKTASSASDLPARAAVCEITDDAALRQALQGRTSILQLIGTMRRRFSSGDTYEASDIGTTRLLARAAAEAGVDHFILLSSVGAGRPVGAYLRAKAEAEKIVRDSGVPWTIFRPSAFDGGGHRPPPGMGLFTRLAGLDRYRPIALEDLARTLLQVALQRGPLDTVLEGGPLWKEVARAREQETSQGAGSTPLGPEL